MKFKNYVVYLITCLLFLMPVYSSAVEQTPDVETKVANKKFEPIETLPDLAEIVPLEIKLVRKQKFLEKEINDNFDAIVLEQAYSKLENEVAGLEKELERLKLTQTYKYNKLVDLKALLKQKSIFFITINKPLTDAIDELSSFKKQWHLEKKQWLDWRQKLLDEGEVEQLRETFDEAAKVIDSSLELIVAELDTLLAIQERAGTIEQTLYNLVTDVDNGIEEVRRHTLFNDTPPMVSKNYIAQLNNPSLWVEVRGGLSEAMSVDKSSLKQHGWIIILHTIIALFLLVALLKKNSGITQVKQWQFLGTHYVAATFFVSYVATILVYEYQGVPTTWKLIIDTIGGFSFAFLMRGVISEAWKIHFIFVLVFLVILTRLIEVLGVPIPLYRIYICLAALTGFVLCFYSYKDSIKDPGSKVFPKLLHLGVWFFGVVILFEVLGRKALASHLFVSTIHSVATILIFSFFMYLLRGGLEFTFSVGFLKKSTLLKDSEAEAIIQKISHFCNGIILFIIIFPGILMIWGVFQNIEDAIQSVIGFGVNFGESRITVGLFVVAASILYLSFLISWIVRNIIVDPSLFKQKMGKGARLSIARLVHYSIVSIGFLLAISALGIEITKITILVSALGVGVGFGLKEMVNNFVSGLVLLFEQPVRVGDIIELDGMWAEIKHIGIRATLVRNFDNADLIIPNADLISNKLTNWTLSDSQSRLTIKVGVAYGTDVDLVLETLRQCAKYHDQVANYPSPDVLFSNFGDSSLDFELRVFVPAKKRFSIKSEINQEIDKQFRSKNIVIAFPQRDIHLSGVEKIGSEPAVEILQQK